MEMKSYVLALLLVLILFVAGCGAQKTGLQQGNAQQTSQEQTSAQEATPVLDEATDVEAVDENLSPDSTEDDYGDII